MEFRGWFSLHQQRHAQMALHTHTHTQNAWTRWISRRVGVEESCTAPHEQQAVIAARIGNNGLLRGPVMEPQGSVTHPCKMLDYEHTGPHEGSFDFSLKLASCDNDDN